MQRRTILQSLALPIAAATLPTLSFAQAPAFDAMRIMIPAGPGGGFDQTGRSLGAALQSAGLTKSVQYENKGGAGGTIGLAQFLNTDKASPNALIVAGLVTVGAVHLNKTPVSLSNVTPIARLLAEANVIAVPAASKIMNIRDLMAAIKANPGAVAFAGGSAGGVDHLLAGLVARESGADPPKSITSLTPAAQKRLRRYWAATLPQGSRAWVNSCPTSSPVACVHWPFPALSVCPMSQCPPCANSESTSNW